MVKKRSKKKIINKNPKKTVKKATKKKPIKKTIKKKSIKKKPVKSYKKNEFKYSSSNLKLIAASFETVLAIPLVGGLLIISSFWLLLALEVIIGIFGVIRANKEKKAKNGHVMQIIAGFVGWVPFLGWLLHLLSAVMLWIEWNNEK